MQNKSKIVLVDEYDQPVGVKYRDEIDPSKDIYRATGVWIKNSQGRVLIAQRKMTKDKNPGKWGPAVAGTVEDGETYESNAYKELEEELGVRGVPLTLGPRKEPTASSRYFGQWFTCVIDKSIDDLYPQEEEVAKIEWVDERTLIEDVQKNPDKYVPSFPAALALLSKIE